MSQVRHGADRFRQEAIGQNLWDDIYTQVWGRDISIERGLGTLLDDMGVDLLVRHPGWPFPIYGQEKTLGYHYGTERGFDTLTVEEWQQEGVEGDAFHLPVHFYACAYLNGTEDAFTHGGIVDWQRAVRASWRGQIQWHRNRNQDGQARASFMCVLFKDIPPDCMLWRLERH